MAARFTAAVATNRIVGSGVSLVGTTTSTTASCWFKLTVDRNAFSTPISFSRSVGNQFLFLQTDNGGTNLTLYHDQGGGLKSATLGELHIGGWYYCAMRISGLVARGYLGKDSHSELFSSAVTTNARITALNMITLGSNIPYGEPINGCVTNLKVWDAALSDYEIEMERRTYQPKRTNNLQMWVPILRHDRLEDLSGRGNNMYLNGSATTEHGPHLPWKPQGNRRIIRYDSAGQPVFQDGAFALDGMTDYTWLGVTDQRSSSIIVAQTNAYNLPTINRTSRTSAEAKTNLAGAPSAARRGSVGIDGRTNLYDQARIARSTSLSLNNGSNFSSRQTVAWGGTLRVDGRTNISNTARVQIGGSVLVGMNSNLGGTSAVARTAVFAIPSNSNLYLDVLTVTAEAGDFALQSLSNLLMSSVVSKEGATSLRGEGATFSRGAAAWGGSFGQQSDSDLYTAVLVTATELGAFSVEALSDASFLASVAKTGNFRFNSLNDIMFLSTVLKIGSTSMLGASDARVNVLRDLGGIFSFDTVSDCLFPGATVVRVSIVELGGETYLRLDGESTGAALFNKEVFFLIPISMSSVEMELGLVIQYTSTMSIEMGQ